MLARITSSAMVFFAFLAGGAGAQEVLVDLNDPPGAEEEVTKFYLPYAIYGETYELGLGFVYAETGRFQEQLGLYGTVLGSSNGTFHTIFGFSDARLPGTERWYTSGFGSIGSFSNLRAYVDGNPDYPDEVAGSNDSDPNDFIRGEALEGWLVVPFRYVLPIGGGKETPHTYVLDRGLLAESSTYADVWNPMKSGRTYAIIEPFYRRQEFKQAPERGRISTNGVALKFAYDNTDFRRNPGRGSRQVLSMAMDPGVGGSSGSWTTVGAELSKYIPLAPSGWQRHRVLALDFWTMDTPGWSETETANGVVRSNNPPYFSGATLGGQRHLRAFPAARFNDKAAIYYAAEYRVIPSWQPLPRAQELRRLEIDWWQLAAFAEVGRVSGSWNLPELHTDMKWVVGVGLRVMAHKQIVRIDLAVAEETWAVLFDLVQPF